MYLNDDIGTPLLFIRLIYQLELVCERLIAVYNLFPSHTLALTQKLDADSEDGYLNTGWTDPHSLKKQLAGVSNVSWRPS